MQNIGAANQDDAFYRYKMPKLVAKIEGRGNGIKTNIVNNVEIAKALDRPPEYPLKYFGCDLGAQTKFDKNTGTSIVNGAHDAGKLSELLEGFIKKYVQCYSCGNPETQIKIKKENLFLKCKACGFVSEVDMRHKLNTFILNNPPENKMSKEEKKLKKAEEERIRDAAEAERRERKEKKDKEKGGEKKKKDKKKKKDGEDGQGSDDKDKDDSEEEDQAEDDDGVVWMTDTSTEAAKRRAAEQLTAATAALVTQGNIEAEEEAARKRAEKAEKEAAAAAAAAAAEEAAREKADEEEKLAKAAAEKLVLEAGDPSVVQLRGLIDAGSDAAAVAAAVKELSVPGGLAGKMRVLYEALFAQLGPDAKIADSIKAKKKFLTPHSKDQPGQLAQLIALEHLLAVVCPDRVKEAALALKVLYDEDLADDEVIIAWGDKADAGKILSVPLDVAAGVRRVTAPLVEWLKEEDDDDEEDEDEE